MNIPSEKKKDNNLAKLIKDQREIAKSSQTPRVTTHYQEQARKGGARVMGSLPTITEDQVDEEVVEEKHMKGGQYRQRKYKQPGEGVRKSQP